MQRLEVDTSGLFAFEPVAESPRIESPSTGLRLAARAISFEGGTLFAELLVTYRFAPELVAAFQDFAEAIVLTLEDPGGRRAAALRVVDPRTKLPARSGDNYIGIRPWPEGTIGHTGGSMVLPLQIRVAEPALPGPGLYVTATLDDHCSNTLAFDLAAATAETFLDDRPFDPAAPQPAPAGASPSPRTAASRTLSLGAPKGGTYGSGAPIELTATLALPLDEAAAFGAEGWLRSLFIWVTRQHSEGTAVGHWLGARAVLDDDFEERAVGNENRAVAIAPFELAQILGVRLEPGVYYVQASARQHRSNALEITCV